VLHCRIVELPANQFVVAATTTTYDALSRPLMVLDGGSGLRSTTTANPVAKITTSW